MICRRTTFHCMEVHYLFSAPLPTLDASQWLLRIVAKKFNFHKVRDPSALVPHARPGAPRGIKVSSSHADKGDSSVILCLLWVLRRYQQLRGSWPGLRGFKWGERILLAMILLYEINVGRLHNPWWWCYHDRLGQGGVRSARRVPAVAPIHGFVTHTSADFRLSVRLSSLLLLFPLPS